MDSPDYESTPFVLLILRSLPIISLVVSAGLLLRAQKPPVTPTVPVQANKPGFKLRVQTNVVVVRAVVRDSHGRAVAGLGKKDFKIFDNRKQQAISGFSVETAPPAISSPQPPATGGAAKGSGLNPATPTEPRASIEPQTYLAFYFDDLNSDFDSVVRSRDAAEKFIAGVPPTERIAIFTSSGTQSLDFTDDRQEIHKALFKLHANARMNSKTDCPHFTDYVAGQIVNHEDPDAYRIVRDEAINECHLDPRSVSDAILRMQAQAAYDSYVMLARANLANLDGVVGRLAMMPGERQVMLVSDGFMAPDMRDRLEGVIDHALRERVIISALDAKGLAVMLREADASVSYMPAGDLAGLYHIYDASREALATGTLAEIAEGTGGQFFHNNNDLLEGFREVLTVPEVSYVLTFSPQNLKYNGVFHTLKVTLANGHGMTVEARKGYFAPKGELPPEENAKEQIREAVFSREKIEDLPLSVETRANKTGTQNEEIEVQAEIDVRSLPFQRQGDRSIDDVIFTVALFDRDGKYVTGAQQNRALALKNATLAELQKSGLDFHAHVSVKIGAYTVRVVVLDAQGGGMAAVSKGVEIPL